MEFTKKDAFAFARLHKGKRAHVRETRRLLEKRFRQLMEQSALLKHDIDTFKSELATVGIHDYLTGVAHVCACAPLCPAVWTMLPEELLQLVFSRLPLPEIIRLRVLSKTWDMYVAGVTPGFTKLCAEQNPNLFALVSEGSEDDGDNGPVVVKLFDSKGKKWHRFVHETSSVGETYDTMLAGSGGLMCLVSTTPDKDMEIVVFNPLTRQGRERPLCSSLSRDQPRMVQLVMDRDSKCYKVLVVSYEEREGNAVARIFSSLTGEWSQPNIFSDLFFGYDISWMTVNYDCASSTLVELDDGYLGQFRESNILVNDRLFVLHCSPKEYVLKEYQAQSSKPHWVRLKVHECLELDEVCRYRGDIDVQTQLMGCQDFLLLVAWDDDHSLPRRTLLFDLSTSEWQIICSGIPEWSADITCEMFKLRWDAVP